MSNETENFLSEGLLKFGVARRATIVFDEMMGSELEGILKARKKWGPFQPFKSSSLNGTRSGESHGIWINATIAGKLKNYGPIEVEIGIWWDAPDLSEPLPVILWANFFGGPKEVKFFKHVEKGGIKSMKMSFATRLYKIPDPKKDFRGEFNLLIDALLKTV